MTANGSKRLLGVHFGSHSDAQTPPSLRTRAARLLLRQQCNVDASPSTVCVLLDVSSYAQAMW